MCSPRASWAQFGPRSFSNCGGAQALDDPGLPRPPAPPPRALPRRPADRPHRRRPDHRLPERQSVGRASPRRRSRTTIVLRRCECSPTPGLTYRSMRYTDLHGLDWLSGRCSVCGDGRLPRTPPIPKRSFPGSTVPATPRSSGMLPHREAECGHHPRASAKSAPADKADAGRASCVRLSTESRRKRLGCGRGRRRPVLLAYGQAVAFMAAGSRASGDS